MSERNHRSGHLAARHAPPGFFGQQRWRLAGLLLLSAAMVPVSAQRPVLVVPARADTVIERLPSGYAKLQPQSRERNPSASIAQIQRLLETAARDGDARLAARADALLERFPQHDRTPAVLGARAFSAQHRHDFVASLRLLDILIELQPRNADARLARAQIHLVQGRLDRARADCVALTLGVDAGDGLLCAASLSLRRGDHAGAAQLMDRWLTQAVASAPARRRHALVLRGEIAARGNERDADRWFRQALAIDADDVRTLAAYARYLRAAGRDRDVEALLAARSDHDGLQLQRTLATFRRDSGAAAGLIEAQARRYAAAHAVGNEPELRDEAEFLLTLRRQPAAALALAQRNFRSQRDDEDVDILRRAAIAARRPDALQPLQAWATLQGLRLPADIAQRR